MRVLVWIGAIIITFIGLFYIVAFTNFGNALVKPFIEQKIKQETNLNVKFTTFSIGMSRANIILALDNSNTLSFKGDYSLFSQSFTIDYAVAFSYLESLEKLTGIKLQGSFYTQGTITGDKTKALIRGKSDIASSQTNYSVDLVAFRPIGVKASIEHARIEELLVMFGQPAFASSRLDLDLKFTSLDPQNLQGDALLTLKDGLLSQDVMQKFYQVLVPNTTFTSHTNIELKGKELLYKTKLSSNLATLESKGTIIPQTLGMDLLYDVHINELAMFKPLTNAPLKGILNLSGDIKGDKTNLLIRAMSDIASSDTIIQATLKEFTLASLHAKIKNMQLAKILDMIAQPLYSEGTLSMNVNIDDAKAGSLKGDIQTTITNGLLNNALITNIAAFNTPMPRTTYTLSTATTLTGDIADTALSLRSNMLTLSFKQARLHLKDNSLVTDYTVAIPNLDNLFFITQRHLKGALNANGKIQKANDLECTFFSKLAGGTIDAKLHNDVLHADIKNVQTLDLLEILTYPKIFKAALNATFDYNILQKQGKFTGKLADGIFTKNQILDLIKHYAKTDMYKEHFHGDIEATIHQEKIRASLDLRSNTSSIKAIDTNLDSKRRQIDADVELVFDKNPVSASIQGDLNAPKVSVDLEKFMRSKAGESIKKEASKLFKKLF